MKNSPHPLKKIRLLAAVACITFMVAALVDIHEMLPPWVLTSALWLQFIPSVLKFSQLATLSAAGFIVVLMFTLLFGRIYCSTICPLGILMDIIGRLRRRVKKQPRFVYMRPHPFVRYGLLTITVMTFLAGSIIAIDLLCPFANFGRIATQILRPIVIGVNNGAAIALEQLGYFGLPPVTLQHVNWLVLAFALAFLATIAWLVITRGRLYCNLICPVGAVLGWMAKLSLFGIRLNVADCIQCRQCVHACKAGCIDIDAGHIDLSRCVACFNCLGVCPTDAVGLCTPLVIAPPEILANQQAMAAQHNRSLFRQCKRALTFTDHPVRNRQQRATFSRHRRSFLQMMAAILACSLPARLAAVSTIVVTKLNQIVIKRRHPITPPGAIGIDHFARLCIGCHACIGACPTQVLQPSLFSYGGRGMFMPQLNNRVGFCNLNCTRCSQICPSGAIQPLTAAAKKRLQIGQVQFVRDNCIVILQGTECGACSEHCPTKAVDMVLEKMVKVPQINLEICIGCGACEYACPAKPHKAIYVEGNPIHLIAKPPKSSAAPQPAVSTEFPF